MKLIKNTKVGKVKKLFLTDIIHFIFFLFFLESSVYGNDNLYGEFLKIKILDKISSKTSTIDLKIGKETEFKNLLIKSLKCKNSEFDDNPEITSYIQVKDKTNKTNDEVFVFNGWAFSSSPALKPFDHPVYDIWLTKCY